MNWYKIAKINKQSFRLNLIYNFYLIASLSKEEILHYLNTDEEFKHYIVKRIDEIKNQYIEDGLKQINNELRHIQKAIDNAQELPQAIYWFRYEEWSHSFYGGESWAKIAEVLYDLYKHPSLEELYWQNTDNHTLSETIYLLIRKIDNFNDLAHNSDLALKDMVDDKPEDIQEFLDYKFKYDIKGLLPYFDADKQLLRAIYEPKSKKPLDLQNAGQIVSMINLGFTDFIDSDNIQHIQSVVANSGEAKYIYDFAIWLQSSFIPGANIDVLQDAIIKTGNVKYIIQFTKDIVTANIKKSENAIIESKDDYAILDFARDIPGANRSRLENAIIENGISTYIYNFAKQILGANIEKLYDAIKKTNDTFWIQQFRNKILEEKS